MTVVVKSLSVITGVSDSSLIVQFTERFFPSESLKSESFEHCGLPTNTVYFLTIIAVGARFYLSPYNLHTWLPGYELTVT